jgi:signal transduction histidine kinase/tetratricopeptide (TPR) repeat protein
VIVIFLLTIFIPSALLSVLGGRAIRNERFRLAKQLEEEQISTVDFFRTQILSQVNEVENTLEKLAQTPSLVNRDYEAINILLDSRLDENNLLKQFFIFYSNAGPWFPPLQPVMGHTVSISTLALSNEQQEKLIKAESYEFSQKNYQSAVSIYNDLMTAVKKKNDQAQLLNRIARNLTKNKEYKEAISIYSRIINEYPESMTSSGLPLVIIARLQLSDCFRKSGEYENALNESLKLYEKLLSNSWILSESQFMTYASLVKEMITDIWQNKPVELSGEEEYIKQLEQLTADHNSSIEQWQIIRDLKTELIPEFHRRLTQSGPNIQSPSRDYKTIDTNDFLVISTMILDENSEDPQGILGVKINNDYLEKNILTDIINVIPSTEIAKFTISNLNGRILYGTESLDEEFSIITAFFENNFPPWRIEAFNAESKGAGLIGLHKSFYFWTILTLLLILSFGVVLIVRTVAHEMEVLRIKSDFVSSVSHEFKTPLTSIKALTERLLEGKVKDQAKMNQYFSVISRDTNKLTHLVGNILDFAKIEEGKKEYDFKETDMIEWLDQTIENFQKENLQIEIKIRTRVPDDVPHLSIDRDAMALVVNNLLDNAIKYSTKKNEIDVFVDKDENNILIKVKDYGIGIPRAELDKIFEKFYQGSNATRLSTKGTGLGLTLVRHTIESHGGEVFVESKVNQGSIFTLSLPIKNKTKRG